MATENEVVTDSEFVEVSTELDLILENLVIALIRIQSSDFLMGLIESEPELKERFIKTGEEAEELLWVAESLGIEFDLD